jgi:DNA-binding transcriptional LysR family regulator
MLRMPADRDGTLLTASGIGLRELEAFIAVAELSSFSLAARRLHLSQPAVSARVQKLEAALSVKLLHRTTRAVELTPNGRHLATRARGLLDELWALVAEMAGEPTRSRVVIVSTPMVSATLLPKLILRYRQHNPAADLRVLDQRYSAALETIRNGECDFGLMALDNPEPKMRFQPLISCNLVVVTPPDHPLNAHDSIGIEDLVQHPVMLLEQYIHVEKILERACQDLGRSFSLSVKAGNLPTILGMLDAGGGVALIPSVMAQHNASRPRSMVPLRDISLIRQYGILSSAERRVSPAARHFAKFLENDLPRPAEG